MFLFETPLGFFFQARPLCSAFIGPKRWTASKHIWFWAIWSLRFLGHWKHNVQKEIPDFTLVPLSSLSTFSVFLVLSSTRIQVTLGMLLRAWASLVRSATWVERGKVGVITYNIGTLTSSDVSNLSEAFSCKHVDMLILRTVSIIMMTATSLRECVVSSGMLAFVWKQQYSLESWEIEALCTCFVRQQHSGRTRGSMQWGW